MNITASFGTLLDQAGDTADLYLDRAIKGINERFGPGYAKKNPKLVAAFMQVAAEDYCNASKLKVLECMLERYIEW